MKIKGTAPKSPMSALCARIFSLPPCPRSLKICIWVGLALAMFFVLGTLWKKGLIEKITRNVPYIVRGYLTDPPERITIDIKFKDFQKLSDKRDEAVALSYLISGTTDYVPAMITHNGKSLKAKLRLKGDYATEHLKGDKWSFRVELKDTDTLFGIKRFSLHHPKARWYLNEWVFHNVLRHEGLIALRYQFVQVTLNGKDLGLYALEEHFGKELIEHNNLREGVIIHYDDNLFLRNRVHFKDTSLISGYNNFGYNASEIRAFEMEKLMNKPELLGQLKTALELEGRLRTGELKLSEAYDIEKLARFYAVCNLLGAVHNTLWPNFTLYYNPVTGKLEPVGFDAEDAMHRVEKLTPQLYWEASQKSQSDVWITQPIFRLWDDELFTRTYLGELERLSNPDYVDRIIRDLEEPMKKNIAHLWTLGLEGITSQSFNFIRERLHENAESIRKKIDVVKGIHAYFVKVSGSKLILTLGDTDNIPMEIEKITYRDSDLARPSRPLILPPRQIETPIKFNQYAFLLPVEFRWDNAMTGDLLVHYRVPGTSVRKTVEVFPWNFLDDDFFKEDFIRTPPNFQQAPFFRIDTERHIIHLKPGTWDVQESILIPTGWKVQAQGATTLNLTNNAKILSYSPLEWIGDDDDPIYLKSDDGSGQGLVVINAKSPSLFKNVIFENLSRPRQGGWELTGAVTFYESEVHFIRCQFLKSRSEDALNIIRSEFSIENSLFGQAQGDALDLDFAKGNIQRTSFVNSQNDALDFSGSVVTVSDVFVDRAGDKGFSVGEESDAQITQATVLNSNIGIAGKDSSKVTAAMINIVRCKTGFALYQKKPEYGPSHVSVSKLKIEDTVSPYRVQSSSELSIDGRRIFSDPKTTEEFIKALLATDRGI